MDAAIPRRLICFRGRELFLQRISARILDCCACWPDWRALHSPLGRARSDYRSAVWSWRSDCRCPLWLRGGVRADGCVGLSCGPSILGASDRRHISGRTWRKNTSLETIATAGRRRQQRLDGCVRLDLVPDFDKPDDYSLVRRGVCRTGRWNIQRRISLGDCARRGRLCGVGVVVADSEHRCRSGSITNQCAMDAGHQLAGRRDTPGLRPLRVGGRYFFAS